MFVRGEDKLEHAKSVRKNLDMAVSEGILEEVHSTRPNTEHRHHVYSDHNAVYKFTHEHWRQKLLEVTLDDWKSELQGLISSVKGRRT